MIKFLLSASVTDMDMALDHVVPESLNWLHTDEGPESVHFIMQETDTID